MFFRRKVCKMFSGLPLFFLLATFQPFSVQASPRLAFQVYAVRDLCEKDFAGTLKAAKSLGYEGVETGRFYGLDAKGLKAACEEAGLELVALQLYPLRT
jgi:predicted ATP-grasp superfamily ATP-dependent carboligase